MTTKAKQTEALRRIDAGEATIADIALEYGVSKNAVYMWRSTAKKAPAEAPKKAKPEPAPKATRKPKAKKKTKARKKRAVPEPKPELGYEVQGLDIFTVCDAWELPYSLAVIVHGVQTLAEGDDFDALETIEAAVANRRVAMEGRAA
jgi:transposase-like protein